MRIKLDDSFNKEKCREGQTQAYYKEHAKVYGLMVAHVIYHVWFWTDHNKTKKKSRYFKDGKWWTYGSIAELQRYYFWQFSVGQVRRAFKKAQELGAIIEGNPDWNRRKNDKTKWYALADEETIKKMIQPIPNMNDEGYY